MLPCLDSVIAKSKYVWRFFERDCSSRHLFSPCFRRLTSPPPLPLPCPFRLQRFLNSPTRRHYLASTGPIPFGVGGWFHAARSTAHILNQTVSTVRSAYALKDVYEEIQKKEQEGTLTEEEKRKLEDKAAQMVS